MANKATDIDSPWMTARQAAGYLQVAEGTIRNWTSAKYVPHVKRGRMVRYDRDRLDRWMKAKECRGRTTFADVGGNRSPDGTVDAQPGVEAESEDQK